MKNFLSLSAFVGVAMLAVVGCGDDPAAPTDINTHFEPKTGDTFTYARYDRDMSNQRVASSKTIHKWVVLQTGLSYQGKNSVTKVLQLNYQADGTTPNGDPDTVYMQSTISGEVFLEVIRPTLARIPIAAEFADSIPFTWFKIGDTKNASAITAPSFPGNIFKTVRYPVPGVGDVDLNMTLTSTANHKGKVATTVNGTSYANAFHTDHTVKMIATVPLLANLKVIDDSLNVSFDIDVANGILRQEMKSDTITATLPGNTQNQPVAGFEMELIGVVRAK